MIRRIQQLRRFHRTKRFPSRSPVPVSYERLHADRNNSCQKDNDTDGSESSTKVVPRVERDRSENLMAGLS